jgi:two-component system chemotaxis response regulator CheY
MKVMVVDDEPDMQLLFEQRFRRELGEGRVQFIFAQSGDEALSYLEGQDGADLVLILSDINMPGMSGLDLLRQLKSRKRELPVYMITAYSDESSHTQALEYGADDYLTKPLDFQELRDKIYRAGGISPKG